MKDTERFTKRDSTYYEKAIMQLQKYENAIENGELVRLPCKVGDTVYTISRNEIADWTVETVTISRECTDLVLYNSKKGSVVTVSASSFAKNWFTDKAQAEAKLQELEGKKC